MWHSTLTANPAQIQQLNQSNQTTCSLVRSGLRGLSAGWPSFVGSSSTRSRRMCPPRLKHATDWPPIFGARHESYIYTCVCSWCHMSEMDSGAVGRGGGGGGGGGGGDAFTCDVWSLKYFFMLIQALKYFHHRDVTFQRYFNGFLYVILTDLSSVRTAEPLCSRHLG